MFVILIAEARRILYHYQKYRIVIIITFYMICYWLLMQMYMFKAQVKKYSGLRLL